MDHNVTIYLPLVRASFFRFLITTAPIKTGSGKALERGRSSARERPWNILELPSHEMKWLYFLFMAFISTHNQAGENI